MFELICDIIKPISNLEYEILKDDSVIEGLLWGRPRNGHPEGEIIYHVNDVLKNIDNNYKNDSDYEKLRIIAILHDTFKYKVNRSISRNGSNHHANIASEFAKRYISDNKVLNTILLHDEVYNIWQTIFKRNSIKRGKERFDKFMYNVIDIDLFIKFYKCDTNTGNKKSQDFEWFLKEINYEIH